MKENLHDYFLKLYNIFQKIFIFVYVKMNYDNKFIELLNEFNLTCEQDLVYFLDNNNHSSCLFEGVWTHVSKNINHSMLPL